MTTLLMDYTINCARSGLPIGKLQYATVSGFMPYLSHWDNMVALHPIFSMPQHKLLAFARGEWNRLAKASVDAETTDKENEILQVCFLALLHSLGSIEQEAASLPPIHVVQANMNSLFSLAYWKHYLESKRFHFPEYKINRFNANDRFENVRYYLEACFEVKKDYESKVDELIELEKVQSAERAMKALRNSWIVPTSNRLLYRWVRAHLPARYEADGQGWMSTLFLGSERTVLEFDSDEVDLMEQIILGECPPGTAILHAVRQRIEKIKQIHMDNREAFTVDFDQFDFEEEGKPATKESEPEPQAKDYPSKVLFLKARALWHLKQRAIQERKQS